MSLAEHLPTDIRERSPFSAPATASAVPETERLARLRLIRSVNVGPRTYGHLMRRFGTAAYALKALPNLAERGGKPGYVAHPLEEAEAEIERGRRMGARMLQIGDPEFPPLLAAIDPPPPVIWVLGDVELLTRSCVAIVGARNATALGLRTARRIARELGSNGHVVVSGLARGIDTAAHDAGIVTGTIAVVAGGLDCPYPPENEELFKRIAADGAVVSEVPFGVEPTAKHFPRRNRLISGLSSGVILIEAAARSGSLITARFAVEQGREAMACPGAPEDPRSAGCNAIIREGAALIRHAGDVEEALAAPRTLGLAEGGSEFEFDAEVFGDGTLRDDYDALADFDEEGGIGDEALAEQILDFLGPQAVEIDEVARQTGASPSELSLAILELDLAGHVELRPGGMIARSYSDE
ncbi:MAG: DNA-processing protein DprA [Pseudomonadota bacterium]